MDDIVQHGELIVLSLNGDLLSLDVRCDAGNASLLLILSSHHLLESVEVLLDLNIQLVYLALKLSLPSNLDVRQLRGDALLARDRVCHEVSLGNITRDKSKLMLKLQIDLFHLESRIMTPEQQLV